MQPTVREGNIDVLASSVVNTELDSGSSDHGADVVGELDSILGMPRDVVSVCVDSGSQGRTVVSTPSDKHETSLGNLSAGLELVLLVVGSNLVLAFYDLDGSSRVGVLGVDVLGRVGHIGSIDLDGIGGSDCSSRVDDGNSAAATVATV